MSRSIHVHTFEVDRACCLDCTPHWYGPIRLKRDRAEKDVERHRQWHREQDAKQDAEWDAYARDMEAQS